MTDDAPAKTAAELVAEAVAARLSVVVPLPKAEPGADFDRECREALAQIEGALK